jgi:signal transduction histidine kinase
MPLREWLKPPRSLLIVLSLLTLVAVLSLIWFGLRLLEQERAADEARRQEQMERGADRVAASMRGILAETREELNAWSITPTHDGQPDQGVFLAGKSEQVSAHPEGRLLYWPSALPDKEAPASVFAEGERLEFVQEQQERAADWYRGLAESHASAAVRAGALMRLARVLRKLGRKKDSSAVYMKLARFSQEQVAGVPAELVARNEMCELHARTAEAEQLKKDLLSGRWRLSRGQFEFYWLEAVRLSRHDESLPMASVALTNAAAVAWKESLNDAADRGERTLWVEGKPFFATWQAGAQGHSLLLLPMDAILQRLSHSEEVVWAIVDGEGRVLAGRRDPVDRAAVRTGAEGRLPWNLYVTGVLSTSDASLLARKRFVLSAVTILVLCVLAGSHFIARAIRKEMEVAKLQANFVSAVSHEFRSPLTSIRQLAELLAEGRATNDRRQVYYDTLVRETSRLQRLVETLLDFGRMEAGARRYQFQTLEAGDLAREVTAEFEPQIAGSGRYIEMNGPLGQCAIQADREALAVALRNLIDNALKYSPQRAAVRVEWGRENGCVAIRVRDQGHGIRVSEQKMIFQKFVRGSAAAAGQVKGTGVGLTIACQIAAAHRGEISVISELGRGSTFTLLLPSAEKV